MIEFAELQVKFQLSRGLGRVEKLAAPVTLIAVG